MTTTYKGASRSDGFTADPDIFTIVTDPKHPLYDERVEAIPLDNPDLMGLIASIAEIGVKTQIHVIRDGEKLLVKDGNQRVRAALEANKLRKERGLDPVQVPFKVVHERNGETQVEKAGMNLRVKSPAMVQARLAAKLEAMGKSREQIAVAMGFTSTTMVDNCLRLLDCAPKVQQAVETGQASPSFARDMAKLPREEQEKKLDEMLAQGISLKGSEGLRAAGAAKRGEKVEKKNVGRRMKNRVQTQEAHDRMEANEGSLKKDGKAVLMAFKWLLGYKGADKNQCDDFAEVLDEMLDAKKPRAKKKG